MSSRSKKIVYIPEIEFWYILPFLRRQLASEMKKNGIDQEKIAHLLEVTSPAVSQYFNNKRALKIKIGKDLESEIKYSADKIIKSPKNLFLEMQRLINLRDIRVLICKIHKKHVINNDDCELCGVFPR